MKKVILAVFLVALFSLKAQAVGYLHQPFRIFRATQAFSNPPVDNNPDTSTGAVMKVDWDEGTGGTTLDTVAPAITIEGHTSRAQASLWTSTGINNTAAGTIGPSTGSWTVQADNRYSSHAGAGGMQSFCMTLNPKTLAINQVYMSIGDAATDFQYEMEFGYTNSCAAGSGLCAAWKPLNGGVLASAFLSDSNMFAQFKTTDVCVSYDATQGASRRVNMYIGGANAPTTAAQSGVDSANGSGFLMMGRYPGPSDANYGDVIIDRLRMFNYVLSKEGAKNYNNDLLVISKMKQDPGYKRWWGFRKQWGLDTSVASIEIYDSKSNPWHEIAKKLRRDGLSTLVVK